MVSSMALRIVISLLVPSVSGSCLPDAIPPASRQNLVNPNGETYPVGVFISNYAASWAAQYLGAALIQDVLGYNVTLNADAPGSGSVAGYYGVTGCRNPSNTADRGCMQGVSYYHVHFESWRGYPSDWDFIQKTYGSMAPKNLGSMGYIGFVSIYLPKPVQAQAYAAEGLALQYFRSWNASWNQPWKYFGLISSVDTSKLLPCNASVMMDDGAMRRHVRFTGDSDGVVINNDQYTGRCDDGFWWTAPSCRANASRCIGFITGGNGWSAEEMMQKYTVWNMPGAIAVAASWGDYTQLPLSGEHSFYWWTPDPSFLELAPLPLQFPPHNAREFAQGIQTSAGSSFSVDTLVSQDLAILAPTVEKFADKLELTLSQMDEILLDQKNTGDSWENVTCRWILANRATWQKWIPDESECAPGFGLFDQILSEFTDTRANVTNKIICEACPPGTFSQMMSDNNGDTYICVPCDKGTSQPSGAALTCTPCKSGEYQDEIRSTECKRCAIGMYQDEEGQLGCKSCPSSTSTLGFGSVAPSECGCPENYIDMDRSGGFECVRCSGGMTCPALSSLVDLESGTSVLGEEFTPKIQKGFYSIAGSSTSTEVFKCRSPVSCPGGPPGTCAGGLIGTPCSQCPAGATWTGSECEDCAGWRQALWAFAVVGIFAFLTVAYYLATSKVTAKATVLFATTASFGMLVMAMQNMGLVGMMTVEWPVSLEGLFSICQFLLLDIDSYGFSCIAGQSESTRYLLSALIFPSGVAWLALCFAVSKLFPKKHQWEGPKVCSTMGAFLQVGFSTMSATSLAPMMCYQHPNGQRSIMKYPGVICGSAEHDMMLVIAWILLVVFVFGFVALCAFAVFMVPRWSAKRQNHFVACARFLVFRFRLVWGMCPLINLPVVAATDYPPIQVVVIAMVLTTGMVMQMLAWPWKVPMLNVTDCIISFCIVLLVTTSTLYLNKIDSTMYAFAAGVSTAMLSGIGVAIGIMVLMTASALFYRSAMGGKKELKFFNLGSVASSEELARKVKAVCVELEKAEVADLSSQLGVLAVFDTRKITTCITLLATEVAPPAEDGRSFKFNKRIASSSFDPSLKRKPQSRQFSSSQSLAPGTKPQEESNEITNATEPEKTETLQTDWM
ncbi:unnamed protein product [Cladocopium goreaui]|uniref:Tyrosine-protein kinase ephrin type A/B receptor-like domain-containing protein n=1 Tax=Cladocopium goreaui TaxID=2562237 RepID=A0A9P1FFA2_9DINO|nr:unnamed protein product [Cladocopium goreaui]